MLKNARDDALYLMDRLNQILKEIEQTIKESKY